MLEHIESYQKLIDDAIALENAEPRESSGKYNGSLLGQCHRKHFWKRKGETPSNPPDARSFRVFKCGHLFEYFVTNLIPKAQKQVMVESDGFLGFADVVTDDEVVDVKSINSKAFWYMDKEGYDVNKEKRQNILQVVFYAKMLGKPKARLVFVSKDDLCIREFGFFVNAWEEELEREVKSLQAIWDKQELPDADPMMDWECRYCNFMDKCKSVGGKVWNKKEK